MLGLALLRLHDDGTSVWVAIVRLLFSPDTITFHPSIEQERLCSSRPT
ncbi:hypothetical protein MicloDRAFT_00012180 [Microvirga lotononidis]|uniref:Uncharacterized protein n=1 Tax=Microvirga lotononidis TaxID=864069 RepID=I4Z105_9HYPH|nr:hypothetical protein MicloDRAFT_00012180 [Microvirga lotononidis]